MLRAQTAANAASITIPSFRPTLTHKRTDPRVMDRLVQKWRLWLESQDPELSDNRPESHIYDPNRTQPEWFAPIQRTIQDSVMPGALHTTNDGRWLSQEVADAATDFFENTADLLPGDDEPFIHGSQIGDLVAEFKAEHGTMTIIVSPTVVLLFAVIDGVPVQSTISTDGDVREEVRKLVQWLRTGQHGAVETTK